MKKPKGAVLLESVMVVLLVAAVSFPLHLKVIQRCREKIESLDEARLPYDGRLFRGR